MFLLQQFTHFVLIFPMEFLARITYRFPISLLGGITGLLIFSVSPAVSQEPSEGTAQGEQELIAPAPIEEIVVEVTETVRVVEPEVTTSEGEAEKKETAAEEVGKNAATTAETASSQEVGVAGQDEKPALKEPSVEIDVDVEVEVDVITESEDLDLIPLPEGVSDDSMLGEPMDDLLSIPGDIPPLQVAPAIPTVPVGEPAQPMLARYKALRIKTEKDPAVVSLWEKAQKAKTFEQQRAGMREYYRLLFKKMRKADSSLKGRIDSMERAYLQRLAQTRVEPTIPLEPPPTPAPLE